MTNITIIIIIIINIIIKSPTHKKSILKCEKLHTKMLKNSIKLYKWKIYSNSIFETTLQDGLVLLY